MEIQQYAATPCARAHRGWNVVMAADFLCVPLCWLTALAVNELGWGGLSVASFVFAALSVFWLAVFPFLTLLIVKNPKYNRVMMALAQLSNAVALGYLVVRVFGVYDHISYAG